MKNFKVVFALAVMLLSPELAFSSDASSMLDELPEEHKSYDLNFVLPIYVAKKITLGINISKDFKKLPNPYGLMEFIPKTDKDPYKWSQIITVTPFIGKNMPADQIIKNFTILMGKQSKDLKILDNIQRDNGDVKIAGAVISYIERGRKVLLEVFAFSGPYDSVLVQYAVPVKLYSNVSKARDKLDDFFIKNVRMVDANNLPN